MIQKLKVNFICLFPQGRDTMELNYAALHLNKKNTKRVPKKRESPEDCVYSKVVYTT